MPGFGNIPTLTFSAPVTGLASLLAAAAAGKMLREMDSRTRGGTALPGCVCTSPYMQFLQKSSKTQHEPLVVANWGRAPGTWPGNVGTLGPGPSTLRAHCSWGGRASGTSLSLTGFFPRKEAPAGRGGQSPPEDRP